MDLISIVHLIASFFVAVAAVFTLFQAFHRYSFQHRIYKMTAKMKPLIIGRSAKEHILEIMRLDGYPMSEAEELYEIIKLDVESRRNLKP
ncbi:MAG: hypothetical protein ACP5N3_04610 [Candidatus Nanoarchaeia archaeon]